MDAANSALADTTCAFCARQRLNGVLEETEHFFLLADHAPLIAGHLLVIPRTHYACYGAVPQALESELLAIKERVRRFLSSAYREPVFFEHGVFRQTVYHAHLHAMPFGTVALDLSALSHAAGQHADTLQDVRDWYARQGHYFYLECPAPEGSPSAALFPPNLDQYFHVLGALRAATGTLTAWQPQPLRRMTSGDKVRALVESWRSFAS